MFCKVYVLFALLPIFSSDGCPKKCSCGLIDIVQCGFKGLRSNNVIRSEDIPQILNNLPRNTEKLEFINNKFSKFDITGVKEIPSLKELSFDEAYQFSTIPINISKVFPQLESFMLWNGGKISYLTNQNLRFPNLRKLWINKGKLTELPADLFQYTPRIQRISLGWHNISKVSEYAFRGMNTKHFESLNLRGNSLTEIPSKAFDYFAGSEIKNLALFTNKIKRIKKNAFSAFKSIRYLDLRTNMINKIDNKAFQDVKIEYLDLGGNPVSHFTHEVDGLKWIRFKILWNAWTIVPGLSTKNYFQCTCEFAKWLRKMKNNNSDFEALGTCQQDESKKKFTDWWIISRLQVPLMNVTMEKYCTPCERAGNCSKGEKSKGENIMTSASMLATCFGVLICILSYAV